MVSDAVGSVGAIVAGLVMLFTGWYRGRSADQYTHRSFDPVLVLEPGERVAQCVDAGGTQGDSLDEVRRTIEAVGGVSKVHDLHVWAVTSDIFTLSAHAVVENGGDFHEVLNGIEDTLKERFNIEHTTIQLETESREDKEFKDF